MFLTCSDVFGGGTRFCHLRALIALYSLKKTKPRPFTIGEATRQLAPCYKVAILSPPSQLTFAPQDLLCELDKDQKTVDGAAQSSRLRLQRFVAKNQTLATHVLCARGKGQCNTDRGMCCIMTGSHRPNGK